MDMLAFEDVDEKLYGGGRGGGKTDGGMAWLIHPNYVSHPKYRGLVIRRHNTDLSDWVDRARAMYIPTKALISGNPVEIRFPSGAVIRTGHLKDAEAYTKYQGHEYQRVLIEEASHIPSEDLYERLIASCRSTIPELSPRILLTSNPDGNGRLWLKKRFRIDLPKQVYFRDAESGRSRMYIPSTVKDNPFLLRDGAYVKYLESLGDPDLRRAWLEGDWDAFSVKGAYYADLVTIAKKENRIREIPYESMMPVDTFWDLGMSDTTVILFIQRVNTEYRIIDSYEMSGEGLAHYVKVLQDRGYVYGRHYLPHDVKARELGTGKSRHEVLQSLLHEPVDILPALPIEDGINALRMRFGTLWIDSVKCRRLIEALEIYRKDWDDELQVFKSKPVHDWSSHFADALRYWAMSKQGIEEYGTLERAFVPPSY